MSEMSPDGDRRSPIRVFAALVGVVLALSACSTTEADPDPAVTDPRFQGSAITAEDAVNACESVSSAWEHADGAVSGWELKTSTFGGNDEFTCDSVDGIQPPDTGNYPWQATIHFAPLSDIHHKNLTEKYVGQTVDSIEELTECELDTSYNVAGRVAQREKPGVIRQTVNGEYCFYVRTMATEQPVLSGSFVWRQAVITVWLSQNIFMNTADNDQQGYFVPARAAVVLDIAMDTLMKELGSRS